MTDKLKKLLSLARDTRGSEEERKSAYEKYKQLKKKYNINFSETEIEEVAFNIICKTLYEKEILYRILSTLNIKDTYHRKKTSKLNYIIRCNNQIKNLIYEEFEYHRQILNAILEGVTQKYAISQIKESENIIYYTNEEFESFSELEKIKIKSSSNNEWLMKEDFKSRVRIE